MALPTDNTQINQGFNGNIIQTEDNPAGVARGDGNLPLTDYQMPVSKIHTGPYGLDKGPVHESNPLAVEERNLRDLGEKQLVALANIQAIAVASHGRTERVQLINERGSR